jgi:hypothetical protein
MWMLLTRNREFLNADEVRQRSISLNDLPEAPLWTDDYSSVLGTLK